MDEVYTDVELWPEEEPFPFAEEIAKGVMEHAVLKKDDEEMFAYEVDGTGNSHWMDDANIPSLLSIPYLLDGLNDEFNFMQHYNSTRSWVLSKQNPYFYQSKSDDEVFGIGSPHAPSKYAWPLGIVMEGLTATKKEDKLRVARALIKTAKQQNSHKKAREMSLLHESFSVDNPSQYTRPHFAWVDSLFA